MRFDESEIWNLYAESKKVDKKKEDGKEKSKKGRIPPQFLKNIKKKKAIKETRDAEDWDETESVGDGQGEDYTYGESFQETPESVDSDSDAIDNSLEKLLQDLKKYEPRLYGDIIDFIETQDRYSTDMDDFETRQKILSTKGR
jgi:hypothetical protein